MDNVPLAASAKRLVLDLPPSCMQFSPIDSSYFVVGTYNLHSQDPSESEPESQTQTQQAVPEATENDVPETESATRISQSRSGSLMLFRLDGHDMYVSLPVPGCSRLIIKPASRSKQCRSLQLC